METDDYIQYTYSQLGCRDLDRADWESRIQIPANTTLPLYMYVHQISDQLSTHYTRVMHLPYIQSFENKMPLPYSINLRLWVIWAHPVQQLSSTKIGQPFGVLGRTVRSCMPTNQWHWTKIQRQWTKKVDWRLFTVTAAAAYCQKPRYLRILNNDISSD